MLKQNALTKESECLQKDTRKEALKVPSDGILNLYCERRSSKRFDAKIQARFFYGNRVYEGMVSDVSEKGMFISTDIRLPISSVLDIMIFIDRQVVKIPVKIRRDAVSDSKKCIGVGAELASIPDIYANFIIKRKASQVI